MLKIKLSANNFLKVMISQYKYFSKLSFIVAEYEFRVQSTEYLTFH